MQDITPDHALRLVRSWFPDPDNLAWLLSVMRRQSSDFVPTFLSACAVRSPLPPELALEVAQVRDRLDRLRRVQSTITAQVPETVAVKGLAVADSYPAGLTRWSGDVDLVAPDRAAVWRSAQVASVECGLRLRAVTTFPTRDGQELGEGLMVKMAGRPTSAFDDPLTVELCTHAVVGNGTTVPAGHRPAGRSAGPADQLVVIAAESLEQPFGLKDVFDAAVLAGQLARAGDGSLSAAWDLAEDARLEPEFGALLNLATRHGMPIPTSARRGAGTAWRARTWRGLRHAGTVVAHPVRAPLQALQRAEVLPSRAQGPRRALWHAADHLLPVTAPVRSALFRFGVPVQVTGKTDRPLLRSPLGDFLLVNGANVAEAWLDDMLAPIAGPEDEQNLFESAWC